MEDSQAYARKLEELLDARRDRLDRDELPRLKNSCKLFQTAFQGVYSVLHKKGVIHDDPYKFELKISEVTSPPEGSFPESEKIDQMSVRLSQFDSYLDFLNNYYQFSTDFLGMGRIKRILGLIRYFNFTQFSEQSNNINTRILAELVGMVKRGSDQLSSGLLQEGLGQMDRASREILGCLKELVGYQRERYKLELRQLVGMSLGFDEAWFAAHKDEALKQVKRKYAEVATEKPFYAELAEEFLAEDYTPGGAALRAEILKRFEIAGEKKVEKARDRSYKGIILDGIRVLAGVNYTIEGALQKLADSSAVIEAHNSGFFARLKAMLRRLFTPEPQGRFYDIDLVDPVMGGRSHENLDFEAFLEEGGRKARTFAGLLQKAGPAWKRIEALPDEQAFRFLERTMEELQLLVKRMTALEEYFKSGATAEDRPRLRSVRTEMTVVKGALIKANQKKHEYVAQMEEMEQMRHLGISSE